MTTISSEKQIELISDIYQDLQEKRKNLVVPDGWITNQMYAESRGIDPDSASKILRRLYAMNIVERDYMRWHNGRKPIYRLKER